MPTERFSQLKIRTKKEDSAFAYFIFESMEGILAYSTLDYKMGDPDRVLELQFTEEFRDEVHEILDDLAKQILISYE